MGLLSITDLLNFAAKCGLPGLILVIWYLSDRQKDKMLRHYREDTQSLKSMYDKNAELVKVTNDIAKDLKNIIVQNTKSLSVLSEAISHNDFCPFVRKHGALMDVVKKR